MMKENFGLFAPPQGWTWTYLEDCVDILDSRRVPVSAKERKLRCEGKTASELFPYYGATGQVGWIDGYLFDEELILLGEDGAPFLDPSMEKAYVIRGKSWVNNHAHVLRAIKGLILASYLYHYLNTLDYSKFVTGATRLKLNQSRLRKIPILLPPIEVQKKIISILEKAEQLKQWRKESDKLADDYMSSVFLKMFGNPIANPMNWKKVRTIDVANCIVPGRDKPKSFTGKIPWITTEDLNHLGKTYNSAKNLGLSLDEIKNVNAKIIPKNSVLMTCVGDLGLVSLAGQDMVINQQLHSFQCSKAINNIFLMFNLSFSKPYIYRTATSTTVPYMNKKNCNSIPTILPPIEKQNKFAKIFERSETLKAIQKQSKQRIDDLFNGLMQKAFRGELIC